MSTYNLTLNADPGALSVSSGNVSNFSVAIGNTRNISATVSLAGPQGAAGAGSGDMEAATYDPQAIADDAFNRANHTGTQTLSTISDVTASAAELNHVDGVTSPIQTQIDSKQASDSDLTAIAGLTPTNDDVIQRKAGAWTNRTMAQVKTDLSLTKSDVGLGSVDNTSDASKPVSTATQTALDGKVDENVAIVGATKTKITYDAKGLVTAGADATQDDVGDGTTYKQYSATEKTKLAGVETAADVTDAANVDAAGATMNTDISLAGNSYFLDEDAMTSDSDTKAPSQQSVKAYVDAQVLASGTGDVVGPAASVDSELALFSGTTGKLIKRATTTGLLKAASGVISAAVAGTDYYAPSGTDVAVADGGTGRSTGTTAYSLVATGTTATGAQQTLANGATTEVLVGGGAAALPVWTTASGSGSPVRGTSPTLTTPVIDQFGTASGLGAAWSSWTPTWTNLTIGNATVAAKYKQHGKTVVARLSVILGTTSSVSGDVLFSLPVTAVDYGVSGGLANIGTASMYDNNVTIVQGYVTWNSTTTARLRAMLASGTYVTQQNISSNQPFTWATSYTIGLTIVYEAA